MRVTMGTRTRRPSPSPNIPLADDHGRSPAAGQFFLPWSITAAKLPAFPPSPFAGAVWNDVISGGRHSPNELSCYNIM